MIEGEQAYEVYREMITAAGLDAPPWSQLSWPERDRWQEQADEVNDKDMEVINVA